MVVVPIVLRLFSFHSFLSTKNYVSNFYVSHLDHKPEFGYGLIQSIGLRRGEVPPPPMAEVCSLRPIHQVLGCCVEKYAKNLTEMHNIVVSTDTERARKKLQS